jgi:hypothetical protein
MRYAVTVYRPPALIRSGKDKKRRHFFSNGCTFFERIGSSNRLLDSDSDSDSDSDLPIPTPGDGKRERGRTMGDGCRSSSRTIVKTHK